MKPSFTFVEKDDNIYVQYLDVEMHEIISKLSQSDPQYDLYKGKIVKSEYFTRWRMPWGWVNKHLLLVEKKDGSFFLYTKEIDSRDGKTISIYSHEYPRDTYKINSSSLEEAIQEFDNIISSVI